VRAYLTSALRQPGVVPGLIVLAGVLLFSLWLVACISQVPGRPETDGCATDTECQCADRCLESLT
jgi:hypothetical protein